MPLKKCIKITANLNDADVSGILDSFDSYAESMDENDAALHAIDDVIESVKGEKKEYTDLFNETYPEVQETAKKETKKKADEKAAAEAAEKIEDVGEKIGGARKDVWSGFRDKVESKISEDEIIKLPLSKIFPEPNYAKLVEQGADPVSLATIKVLRDEIPKKGRKGWKLKHYVGQVNLLRDTAASILNDKSFAKRFLDGLRETGELKSLANQVDLMIELGFPTVEGNFKGIKLEQVHYSLYRGEKNVTKWVATDAKKSTGMGGMGNIVSSTDAREDALSALKEYIKIEDSKPQGKRQTKFDVYKFRGAAGKRGWIVGKKLSGRKYIEFKDGFEKSSEARKYITENQEKLEVELKEKKKIPAHRKDENEARLGDDYRAGKDITAEEFQETFGFRGVEFGNWVEQKKRQQDLNDAYDGFMDLAKLINIAPEAISFNGQLGMAFGARGRGGKFPAKAHYESAKVVINMTKKSGSGSLAHEWFHGLDNYFSRLRDEGSSFVTTRLAVQTNESVRPEMLDKFKGLVNAIRNTELSTRSEVLDKFRPKDYWSTTIEMAARSFESYVINELSEQGFTNDYLANIRSEEAWGSNVNYPYILKDEMAQIKDAFDNLFEEMKSDKTDRGVALFSKAGDFKQTNPSNKEKPKKSITSDQLTRLVKIMQRDNAGSRFVTFHVADSQEAAFGPDSVREHGIIKGGFYSGTDEIVLIAENIKDVNDAIATIRHELVGHYGLRQLLNKEGQYDKLLKRVYDAKDGDLKDLYDFVAKAYPNLVENNDTRTIADEMLARAAETKTDSNFLKKIYDAIIKLLNKLGLVTDSISRNEVDSLIRSSAAQLKKGALASRRAYKPTTAYRVEGNESKTDTPEFKNWSGGGEVVESEDINDYTFKAETPTVVKVFHGTTHKFDAFDAKRGNLEGQFGAINYFTSSEQDASDNYAGEGPDLTNRIEQRAEQIEQEQEIEMDDARDIARNELSGGQEDTMELFVRVDNPFVIGENAQWVEFVDNEEIQSNAIKQVADNNDITVKEVNENIDDYENEIDEARWDIEADTEHSLVTAIQTVSDRNDIEAAELAGQVYDLGGQATPETIEEMLRSSEDYQYAEDPETGELVGHQLIAEVIEEMGFDSIILKNAEKRFTNMGMSPDTAHIHIFDSKKTNIKSTDNTGTFDPGDPRIRFSRAAQEANDAPTDGNLGMPDEKWKQKFVRLAQDSFNRVKQLQETIKAEGGTVKTESDVYQAEELSSGKITSRLKALDKQYIKPMLKLMKDKGISIDILDSYLLAKHAKERNSYIATINEAMPDGGSGITNQEADDILEDLSGQKLDLETAAEFVYGANKQSLVDLVEGGHMKQETVDEWSSRWEFYVPLKGKDGEDIGMGTGSGYSISGSGIKKAMGRGEGNIAESPAAHTFAQAETTIVRTEKSRIGQALVELVRDNPDPAFWTISQRTFQQFETLFGEPFEGYETAPEGLIENLDYHRVSVITPQERALAAAEDRKAVPQIVFKIDNNYKHRDDVFSVMVKGEELLINIKDKVVMEQLKKMNSTQLNAVFATFGTVNRYFAMINTALNPEFVITNLERDFQTAMVNLGGEYSAVIAAKVAKSMPGAVRGIWQATFDTRGTSEWRTTFEEMEAEGGTIGFFGLEDVDTKVKKIQRTLDGGGGVLGRSRKGIAKVRDRVLDANLSVENAARLAAYKIIKEESIANGMSEKHAKAKAASVAKNLTVNFNRKGELAPFLNSAYLFYNASIQGSARIVTALKHKRVQKIVSGIAATAFALAIYNRSMGDDDDDIPYWDKISDHVKQTHLIIMHPDGSGNYSKIKLPYGYNVFFYAGTSASDLMYSDKKTVGQAAMGLLSAAANAFNPIQGADLLDTVIPTIGKPIEQDMRNINFMGAKITPEYPFDTYDRPESQKSFKSTNPLLKNMMAAINETTGGDETHSGLVDVSPETVKHYAGWVLGGMGMFGGRAIDTATKLAMGEDVEMKGVPFARTLGGKPGSYYDADRFYTAIKEVAAVEAQIKLYKGTDKWKEYKSDNSEVHKLAFRVKTSKNKVKRLRDQRDKAYLQDDRDLANEKAEEIRQEMMKFSILYEEAVEAQE